MGMFDSFYIKCPECNKELEFQSKSGPCAMFNFKKSNLSSDVAIGINGDIVNCEFCNNNFRLECNIPKIVKIKLIKTKKKEDYRGNYNPDTLKNKRRAKELRKMFGFGGGK